MNRKPRNHLNHLFHKKSQMESGCLAATFFIIQGIIKLEPASKPYIQEEVFHAKNPVIRNYP